MHTLVLLSVIQHTVFDVSSFRDCKDMTGDPLTMPIRGHFVIHRLTCKIASFIRSLLRAGVQPTLDSSAQTFMSVQCASPGRGEELVGVCGICASCVGWRKGWVGVSSLLGISKRAPSGVAYCLAKPGLALIQCQPWPALLLCLASGLSHIYLLRLSRRRD